MNCLYFINFVECNFFEYFLCVLDCLLIFFKECYFVGKGI